MRALARGLQEEGNWAYLCVCVHQLARCLCINADRPWPTRTCGIASPGAISSSRGCARSHVFFMRVGSVLRVCLRTVPARHMLTWYRCTHAHAAPSALHNTSRPLAERPIPALADARIRTCLQACGKCDESARENCGKTRAPHESGIDATSQPPTQAGYRRRCCVEISDFRLCLPRQADLYRRL